MKSIYLYFTDSEIPNRNQMTQVLQLHSMGVRVDQTSVQAGGQQDMVQTGGSIFDSIINFFTGKKEGKIADPKKIAKDEGFMNLQLDRFDIQGGANSDPLVIFKLGDKLDDDVDTNERWQIHIITSDGTNFKTDSTYPPTSTFTNMKKSSDYIHLLILKKDYMAKKKDMKKINKDKDIINKDYIIFKNIKMKIGKIGDLQKKIDLINNDPQNNKLHELFDQIGYLNQEYQDMNNVIVDENF